MQVDIVERAPVRVAALRYTGPFGEPLGRWWRNTVAPWLADNGLFDCPRYGVTLDDPLHTPPDRCRYDACVAPPVGIQLPDAPEQTIPGGRYAVTRFKGTGADIGQAWGAFHEACAARGLAADAARAPFEHYPRGAFMDPKTGVFACELCLPVGG